MANPTSNEQLDEALRVLHAHVSAKSHGELDFAFTRISAEIGRARRAAETGAHQTHFHCDGCDSPGCKGVSAARPPREPSPDWVRRARAQGRAEFLNILKQRDAESFIDDCVGEHAIADTGDYGQHWNEEELAKVFAPDDEEYSLIDRLEASYWSLQAEIDSLRTQSAAETTAEDDHSARVQFDKYHAMQGLLLAIAQSSGPHRERAAAILAGDFSENALHSDPARIQAEQFPEGPLTPAAERAADRLERAFQMVDDIAGGEQSAAASPPSRLWESIPLELEHLRAQFHRVNLTGDQVGLSIRDSSAPSPMREVLVSGKYIGPLVEYLSQVVRGTPPAATPHG